jgi:hypothetical protein
LWLPFAFVNAFFSEIPDGHGATGTHQQYERASSKRKGRNGSGPGPAWQNHGKTDSARRCEERVRQELAKSSPASDR